MNSLRIGLALLAMPVLAAGAGLSTSRVLDIRDFDAKPDGTTLCTAAIQKAVEQCATNGSGTVRLPAGSWLTGAIFLRSHVALQLDTSADIPAGALSVEPKP